MSVSSEQFDYCIYHSPCTDGLVSAWIIRKICPKVELIKCTAGANPTHINDNEGLSKFVGKNIIFVDICCTPDYLKKLSTVAENIIIIDHHLSYHNNYKQMYKTFPENVFYIFDEKKAACQLVWEKLVNRKTVPWFIHYIADRDLFLEKMPHSRAISQALYDGKYIRSFDALDELYAIDESSVPAFKDKLVQKGQTTLVIRKDLIKSAAKSARRCTYGKLHIWLYTCPKFLMSDVGARLMTWKFRDHTSPDFVVGYLYDIEKHQFKLSFRAKSRGHEDFNNEYNEDEDDNEENEDHENIIGNIGNIDNVDNIDVSKIAIEISRGGGGHRSAAACTISASTPLKNIFEPFNENESSSDISENTFLAE